jgi:hypothetical protein
MIYGLENAVDHLLTSPSTSTRRLELVADYIKRQLERNGLPGAQGGSTTELRVPGLSRDKNWDVAYEFAGKFRLLVSLKSMLKNISGSVPNRLDDLQGEAANVQLLWPEIIVGYVILLDVAADSPRKEGGMWSDMFEGALKKIAIRKSPLWAQGLLESVWFIRFDSRKPVGRRLLDPRKVVKDRRAFTEAMLSELRSREPAVPIK